MRSCRLIPLALLLVGGVVAAPPAATDTRPDADRIARLVQQLGSRKFSAREAATKALDQIGAPALDALKAAARSKDPEVHARAEKLVKAISLRTESATVLAPKRLHLVFKDTPVEQAVAELSKKTGYVIRLVGDKKTWANRKVTLDTGETTFWRAFDAFCDKAQLVDAPPELRYPRRPQHLPMMPAPPAPAIKGGAALPAAKAAVLLVQLAPPRGGAIRPLPAMKIMPGYMPGSSNDLLLTPGKPTPRPTFYYGAVRIRADSAPHGSPRPAAGQRTMTLDLQVLPEPRLHYWNVVNVRIEKAIDDQDQRLTASGATGPNAISGAMGGGMPGAPNMLLRRRYMMGNNHLVAVQVQVGDKPAKMLKQLKGLLSAIVRNEDTTLLTVDHLLEAANKTVKDSHVGSLKVTQVTDNKDGTFTLQVDAQQVNGVLPGTPARPAAKGERPTAAPVKGLIIRRPGHMTTYLGLTTLDAKGEAIPISRVSVTGFGGGTNWTQRITLTLKPAEGQGKPAKLTFTGSRMVTVTIPFELKNVPLS